MGKARLAVRYQRDARELWRLLADRLGDGARTRFQEIVQAIVVRDAKQRGFTSSIPGTPDGGVDCLVRDDVGRHIVWQIKYVFDAPGLVKQARESLRSLAAAPPANLVEWVLAAPFDVSVDTTRKIEGLVKQRLGAHVVLRVAGASDLRPLVLELGEGFCREEFGSEAIPAITPTRIAVLLATAGLALWLGHLAVSAFRCASAIQAAGEGFVAPDVRRLLTTPLGLDEFSLLPRVATVTALGFSDYSDESLARFVPTMGPSWREELRTLLPPLAQYQRSPSAAKCNEFLEALELLRDGDSTFRASVAVFLEKDLISARVQKLGLVCQIVRTGDLRVIAIAALAAEHDRRRCVSELVEGIKCHGASSAKVLGVADWKPLFDWLGVVETSALNYQMGAVRFGACDQTIKHTKWSRETDAVVLLSDMEFRGNLPLEYACDLVSWSDVSFKGDSDQCDVSKYHFGLALLTDGRVVAYRTDPDGLRGIVVGSGAHAGDQHFLVRFSLGSDGIELVGSVPGTAQWSFAGGLDLASGRRLQMAAQLFPDDYGYGDDVDVYGLEACTSPSSRWFADLELLEFLPLHMQPSSAVGLESWDGTEDVARSIAVLQQGRFVRSGVVGSNEIYRLSDGASLRILARPDRRAYSGVLSFLARVPSRCELTVAKAKNGGFASVGLWRRESFVASLFEPAELVAHCPAAAEVEIRAIQWEAGRTAPSPALASASGRRCRKREISTAQVLPPDESWPVLVVPIPSR
ncbi:MAG: hypothetical protein ABL886_10475 [Rhodoglobus sp.]